MSPAHDFSEPVRRSREALDALMANTSQKQRALAVGLTCHSNVSRLEDRVACGQADNHLTNYGVERFILLMRAFPEFAAAIADAVRPDAVGVIAERCSDDLVGVASTCTRAIDAIVHRLPQGLTRTELNEIDETLRTLVSVAITARGNIARRLHGRGD